MDVLFVHPNFPGQFRRFAAALAHEPGLRVSAIGDASWMAGNPALPAVELIAYSPPSPTPNEVHPYLSGLDLAVRRGQQVVRALMPLKRQGFEPEVIVAHPGWGDALFLRDIFPTARVVGLFEYYYRPRGADVGFDPEYPSSFEDLFRVRILNATQLLAFEACDQAISSTEWQRDCFPETHRARITVQHEGIDTDLLRPDPEASATLPDGTALRAGEEILTFVSRSLEPYRGYHVFMRSLPAILRARPNCRVVIVGDDGTSYGPPPSSGQSYKLRYLREVEDKLDISRVHFAGTLAYEEYLKVLQVSRVHVYLTYPFILSWSLLEAMSAGCLVVASATGPVQEVVKDGGNGMLFPFFDTATLSRRVIQALEEPESFAHLRQAARRTIRQRYDFARVCYPLLRQLLNLQPDETRFERCASQPQIY